MSLESIFILKGKPKLNTQVSENGKCSTNYILINYQYNLKALSFTNFLKLKNIHDNLQTLFKYKKFFLIIELIQVQMQF